MAQNPTSYFSDPKERELAGMVWDRGAKNMASRTLISSVSLPFIAVTWSNEKKQMLYASDFITGTRGDGEDPDCFELHAALGKPAGYFPSKAVGGVEHFFRAAFLSHVGTPALGISGSAIYDLVVDPLLKRPIVLALEADNEGASWRDKLRLFVEKIDWIYVNKHSPNPFADNLDQFVRYDAWGAQFYTTLAATEPLITISDAEIARRISLGVQAFLAQLRGAERARSPGPTPPTAPAVPAPPSAPSNGMPAGYLADFPITQRGMMLSKVSEARYQTLHLWPLLWDVNRALIGENPNRLPPGVTLRCPKLANFTPAQIAAFKGRSPTWRNYPGP